MRHADREAGAVQPAEQLRYARLLVVLSRAGLLLGVAGFVATAMGLLAPQVPLAQLADLWRLPVSEYAVRAGVPSTPAGFGWLALAGHGDVASLLGIALLAGCSAPCLLAVAPLFARRGERALAALCVAEAAVLALAASGLLAR